jgi:hypothetical protein
MNLAKTTPSPFFVSTWIDLLGAWVHRFPGFWNWLGNVETHVLADHLAGRRIEQPIYISGLARSGSTILLEILALHDTTATHAYKDFPPVLTPYFWNWFLDRAQKRDTVAVERAHGDGITVTPESPEALEEVLWMAFFPHVHDPRYSSVLNAATAAPAFASFYRNHLCKLLWLRGGTRYLAKGNYNITRLEYLLQLFPDARFVIPVREPVSHIASLQRQHERFCKVHREDPRALRYMQRVGHFEFGLDRRAINMGDSSETVAIMAAWQQGRDVEGLARLWRNVHQYILDRLEASPTLRDATLILRFEDLCDASETTLRAVFAHCRLPVGDDFVANAAARVRKPSYCDVTFDAEALETIAALTSPVAVRFGYGTKSYENSLHRYRFLTS